MLDTGDIVVFSEGLLMAGTWAWVFRLKKSWTGWREKSALWGLICATLAIALDLALTVVMQVQADSNFAIQFLLVVFIAGIVLAVAGLTLGALGKGTPKLAALLWSLEILIATGVTVVGFMEAIPH
jgi:hypothetical protein